MLDNSFVLLKYKYIYFKPSVEKEMKRSVPQHGDNPGNISI